MNGDGPERQLNIHLDPDNLAGVYANFANISFSDYEFTLTFARIDHEVEEGDIPGVVVTRVNVSSRFMKELLDAMNDSWWMLSWRSVPSPFTWRYYPRGERCPLTPSGNWRPSSKPSPARR